jgi:hypothetical protein
MMSLDMTSSIKQIKSISDVGQIDPINPMGYGLWLAELLKR